MPQGLTRRFWMTVRTPADAGPGLYKGTISIRTDNGGTTRIPLEFRVRSGTLDPVDIPAGPFGYTIGNSLVRRRSQGRGVQSADGEKELAEDARLWLHGLQRAAVDRVPGVQPGQAGARFRFGRRLDEAAQGAWASWAVSSYGGGVSGFDAYHQDTAAMGSAGFTDYSAFVKAIYSQVAERTRSSSDWIPVYYNLADEPIGDDLVRPAENAESLPAGVSEGAAVLHRGQQLHRQRSRRSPFPAGEGTELWFPGTTTMKPSVNLLHSAGGGLGLLQRREPLDLRHLHVQSGEAVRDEVPALVALERGCGRPVLRARLPGRRLRLVQHVARRRAHSFGRVRAAARRAGRLPAADHAGQAGGREIPRPLRPEPRKS